MMPTIRVQPADAAQAVGDWPTLARLLVAALRAVLDRLVGARRDMPPEFFRHPFP
jgi:hypothetical protein